MTAPDSAQAAYEAGLSMLIRAIPEGRVVTYGDAARIIGYGTGRHSARALSSGRVSDVPWWRVVRADGTMVAPLAEEAHRRWTAEGTPVVRRSRASGPTWAVDLTVARWVPGPDTLREVDDAMGAAPSL